MSALGTRQAKERGRFMPTRQWRAAIWCRCWTWCDPFILGPTLPAQTDSRHRPARQQHVPHQSRSVASLAQNCLRLERLPPLLLADHRPRIPVGVLLIQSLRLPRANTSRHGHHSRLELHHIACQRSRAESQEDQPTETPCHQVCDDQPEEKRHQLPV